MQLKQRLYGVLFAAVFALVVVAFTLSSSVPKTRATEAEVLTSMEQSVKSLAGAFSILAGDVREMKRDADARWLRDEADAHAETISRQQLTEAIDRLTARMDEREKAP